MRISKSCCDLHSTNQQSSAENRVPKNQVAYAILGALILGTVFRGAPAPLTTRISANLASIQYGAIGGIAGAIIGGLSEKDLPRSIITAIVYGFLGFGIGSFAGPATIVGCKPYIGPILGGIMGVIVAEMEPRIQKITNKIFNVS
jgi:hypothetical protein